MGYCSYCHEKAGIFKDAHSSCIRDADQAKDSLRALMKQTVSCGDSPPNLSSQIAELKVKGRLNDRDAQSVMVAAADEACLKLAMDTPVSNEDAERISSLFSSLDEKWHEDPRKLVNWAGYISVLHSNTIYEVLHRQTPYQNREAFSDFNLQADEDPILRRNVTLAEVRTVSSGGHYQSIGVPIGAGMYYRVGMSSPRSQQTGPVPVDQGLMVITTKAILFSGEQRSFRLVYKSILKLDSYADGFGVHETNGKTRIFLPAPIGSFDEGWYFYNLVSALSKW